MKNRKRSEAIYLSSCQVIPGGVNSPVRSFPGLSLTPLIAAKGKGDIIWDVDNETYIDFCCGWGSLILGHAKEHLVKAVQEQVALGSSFGLATESEELLAKKIISHMPSMQKLRFVSSGTEATMSALRLSRGFTRKPYIVKFDGNYHGHSDGLLVRAGSGVAHINEQASSKGIPEEMVKYTLSLPFNDVEKCAEILRKRDDIAAVIIEPIAGNMGVVPASLEFLAMLREETAKKNVVLIFDEVISGFRVGLQGAQGLYQIEPDLTCLGKIIGGGFPAAAFGGRADIMNLVAPLGEVYQAGTLSGNPIAMRAGLETLLEIEKEGFYPALEKKTVDFLAPIEQAIKGKGCIQRQGSMFTLFLGPEKVESLQDLQQGNQEEFKRLFCYLFERGIYIPPSPHEAWFISSAHTDNNLKHAQETLLHFLTH